MRSNRLTLTDLVACVVMVALLSTIFLAGRHAANEEDNRKRCASNLRMIGQAFLLYANENKGAYPRTIYDRKQANKPTWGTPYEKDKDLDADEAANPFAPDDDPASKYRPVANDVTAALFLTVRTQDITSEVFICPSTKQDKWDFGGGKNHALYWTNWRGNAGLREHLSYSYQNPYPSQKAAANGFKLNSSTPAEFVIASDINPGGNALLKLSSETPIEQQAEGNSPNHGGEGQNVLHGDGHVSFEPTPLCGAHGDNVFTYGDSGTDAPKKGGDGVVGSPVGANDSILLPTAQNIQGKPTEAKD